MRPKKLLYLLSLFEVERVQGIIRRQIKGGRKDDEDDENWTRERDKSKWDMRSVLGNQIRATTEANKSGLLVASNVSIND